MEPKTDSKEQVVYHWSPQKYIELVEHTGNPFLREYQQVELEYVTSKIQSPETKTFIDVGAGYGRVLPQITRSAGGVIAVEIDREMFGELKNRAEEFGNVQVIEGDGNQLPDLLKDKDVIKPVILSLQNSLGPWIGDWRAALSAMRKVAQDGDGEVIVSVLCQEDLEEFGIPMYRGIAELVGEPDLERTDFERGIYWSKTNYRSKWFTPEERREISQILGGEIVGEVKRPGFYILHITYNSVA